MPKTILPKSGSLTIPARQSHAPFCYIGANALQRVGGITQTRISLVEQVGEEATPLPRAALMLFGV